MISRLKNFVISFLTVFVSIKSIEAHVTIEQCPGSEVPFIRQQVQYHEVSLIFYYTRWSADSLAALKVYNDVAQYYSDTIYFSSVDCWHISCNCSKTLNSGIGLGLPHKWPTLVAHYGRRGQLQIIYHGLWSFGDIQKFVNNLLYPLERLYYKEDLHRIGRTSDAVIVGVFENAECDEYLQYLIASLKWLENDPLRTYRYAVVFNTSDTKNSWSTDFKIPNLLFVGPTNTRSLRNSQNNIWNASNILMWLHKELKKDFNKLHGYATPITIAQKMVQQPVLAIFINNMHRFLSYLGPVVDTDLTFTDQCIKCINRRQNFPQDVANITKYLKMTSDESYCYYDISVLFRNMANYYEINSKINEFIPRLIHPLKGVTHEFNKLCTKEFLDFYHTTKCLRSNLISSNTLQIGIVKHLQKFVDNSMEKLSSNRSMSVVLLKTSLYKDYLQNLDIPTQMQSMATAFIIDREQEGIFLMENTFDIENLRKLIYRFHNRNLTPYHKSESVKSPRLIAYNSEFHVNDLNRNLFLNHLNFANNQTLVVLIHSDECALCGALQQTFIQLAASLRHISAELNFVRINAFHNQLPWHFNMPSLPALLVFPKYQYGETRLFPAYLKPDLRSVFAFLLNQVAPQDQIKIAMAYCQSSSLSSKHSQSCWHFSKTLLMQQIAKHLHYWQMFENERNIILEHLRALKDISLDIQRNLRL